MQRNQLLPVFRASEPVTGRATSAVVNEGLFVKVSGDKTTDGAYPIVHCTAGDACFGVSENNSADPSTEDAHSWRLDVAVNRDGSVVRMKPGATLSHGDLVTSDANGKAVAATSGDNINGEVMSGAASTDASVEIRLFNGGVAA